MNAVPWHDAEGAIELAVLVVPRAGATRVEGVVEHSGRLCLRLRLAAAPVDGAANKALVAWLADALDLPRSAVTLIAGDRARLKRLRIRGDGVAARLASLAGSGAADGRPAPGRA